MRLLNAETLDLEEFENNSIPKYAILSHTWEHDEVSFKDMRGFSKPKRKLGYNKIRYACQQAKKDGLRYVWVDTCKCLAIESFTDDLVAPINEHQIAW